MSVDLLAPLSEVDIDLTSSVLLIGGQEVPYLMDGLTIRQADGVAQLTVNTLALGGRVHGRAEVIYEVEYLSSVTDMASNPKAQGPSVPAALRALADVIEVQP